MKNSCLAALTAMGLAVAPATAAAQNVNLRFHITLAPPAPQAETPPPAPAPSFAWLPGYWSWVPQQAQYAWVPGHWEQPPEADEVWAPARWVHRGRFWNFTAGFWQHRSAPQPPQIVTPIGTIPVPALPFVPAPGNY